MNGRGVETYANGDSYEGAFRKGKAHDKRWEIGVRCCLTFWIVSRGKYTHNDGSQFVGEFDTGVRVIQQG